MSGPMAPLAKPGDRKAALDPTASVLEDLGIGRASGRGRLSLAVSFHFAAVGPAVRGRSAASPSRRQVLADRCRSRPGCLLTMRVRLHGFPNAQESPARLDRYGLCGYRHIL
jgi:hypothetical protein